MYDNGPSADRHASIVRVSKAIVRWYLYINSHADSIRGRGGIVKSELSRKHAMHPGVDALLLREHGADTGSATRDTLL